MLNMNPDQWMIHECVNDTDALLRQRENQNVVRRCHRVQERRKMESIGHVYQRFWLVSKSEDTHIFGCRQYGNAVRLEPPEFIDGALRIGVTLLALLAQSWLVGVRILPAYPNQLANMFLDRCDAA